jgi:hypothetical protein
VFDVGVVVVVHDASTSAATINKLKIAKETAFVTFSSLLFNISTGIPG